MYAKCPSCGSTVLLGQVSTVVKKTSLESYVKEERPLMGEVVYSVRCPRCNAYFFASYLFGAIIFEIAD